MSIDNSALDLLAGGGSSAKFSTIGEVHKGEVVSAVRTQQTDFDTGLPKSWDNGDPMWQVVITLQTAERDADDATDDGIRKIYAKGEMLKAIQRGLKEAGATLEVGGTLAIEYTGDGEAKKRGMSPPKLYRAQYKAPSPVTAEAAESLI